jgi:predicted negative regulator of RcsB-dependent stress response
VPEHISRKELKQDKIRESLEHGAEAVFSHTTLVAILVLAAVVAAAGYAGWRFYSDRKTAEASAAFDIAMKAYTGRIAAAPDPNDPSELVYPDESARSEAAEQKFSAVAEKFPRTNPGRLAAYYSALCLEDLSRFNQALEQLKKISSGSDRELASMAQYQTALIYARTGKVPDATKLLRTLADHSTIFVPRSMVLLELADLLRQSNQQEAANVYQQIKKEFPNSAISDEADRQLETILPKS